MCVNKSNEFVWFLGEFLYGYVLLYIVKYAVEYYKDSFVMS